MTLDEAIADDFANVIDTPEAVTVTIKRAGETIGIPVEHANKNAVDRRLSQYGGVQIQGDQVMWVIPANELGGEDFHENSILYDMQNGDTIKDANGDTYIVQSAGLKTLGSRWTCLTKKMPK